MVNVGVITGGRRVRNYITMTTLLDGQDCRLIFVFTSLAAIIQTKPSPSPPHITKLSFCLRGSTDAKTIGGKNFGLWTLSKTT